MSMSEVVHVASRKGLFSFRRGPDGKWGSGPPAFLAEPVSQVLTDPRDGAVYAALNLGHFGVKLHRSDDGGSSWTELKAPAFPEVEGPDAKAPSVDCIWSLEAGGADQPGLIWAGCAPAGLFVSRDRGESWSLIESLWDQPERKEWMGGGAEIPMIHSIRVDPRDSRRLTLAISTGGVWKSDDGAESWRLAGKGLRAAYMPPDQQFNQNMQDVHRISPCAAAPDVVWCQHHNGVFRSADGGDSFEEITEISPSVFGFAVAAHPADPRTAWFVPAVKDECRVPVDARLVVTRTRDGGRSFEALSDGLPSPSWDLIYRHALDVDGSGERLAMGSTTGNFWISEDAGESWTHVSAHLPPIAQVAFG
jgi:photosystem II stability/assembly factor-like uncharacterized protein